MCRTSYRQNISLLKMIFRNNVWVGKMLEQYMNWYNLALEALNYEIKNLKRLEGVEEVVVVGMGGSGIVGDMLSAIAQTYARIPLYTYKDFYIPQNFINKSTFILAISYSGNTLETISSVQHAIKVGIPIGIVASGGELIDIAKKHHIPYVIVRQGLAPRSALPILLIASIKILHFCGIPLIPMDIVEKSIQVLRDAEKAVAKASQLAEFLNNSRLPLIVSTTRFAPLATRFKNELNENAKMPAKVEIAPELFHNDIVGWERKEMHGKAIVINSDISYENLLLDFYADYLKSVGFEVFYLKLEGNVMERYLEGSLIAGLTSVKIANKLGFDPLQTRSIAMYKDFLKKYREKIVEAVLR
jgi:glucose/mannose-6-phosphate isomerase